MVNEACQGFASCFCTAKALHSKAIQLLQETLGDPNCRVVLSLKSGRVTMRGKKTDFCLRRIVLHNPKTQTYCVMVYDGKELKLVSGNNAGDDYGNEEWTLA